MQRNQNRKNGLFPDGTVNIDLAPMVMNNPVTQRQAKAGSFFGALGGKKRLKDLVLYFRGNALTIIEDADLRLTI
jgi:hypothetical protein